MISLQQYVERAKEGQKSIFYIASDSLAAAASAPFVEQLIKKDLEVIPLSLSLEIAQWASWDQGHVRMLTWHQWMLVLFLLMCAPRV